MSHPRYWALCDGNPPVIDSFSSQLSFSCYFYAFTGYFNFFSCFFFSDFLLLFFLLLFFLFLFFRFFFSCYFLSYNCIHINCNVVETHVLMQYVSVCVCVSLLSGVPDFFDRNKILSGGDLSHYQVPHCIRVFFYFV